VNKKELLERIIGNIKSIIDWSLGGSARLKVID